MPNTDFRIAETVVVPPMVESVRLSDLPAGIFSVIPSRKGLKKAINRQEVLVNGKTASTGMWIHGGETLILIRQQDDPKPTLNLKLEVLFEDSHLAVVNKPPGIEVSGNKFRTLENALAGNLASSSQTDDLAQPQAVHRLDFPTSGAVLVGKTRTTVAALNALFAERKIEKSYLAVTIGKMPDSGEINFPVDGKPASSTFEKQQSIASDRFGMLNLVRLFPHTGRRHQLRKHLSAIGNPILGDNDYGFEGNILKGKGLYLHAESLRFKHPVTEAEMEVKAPVPEKFRKIFTPIVSR